MRIRNFSVATAFTVAGFAADAPASLDRSKGTVAPVLRRAEPADSGILTLPAPPPVISTPAPDSPPKAAPAPVAPEVPPPAPSPLIPPPARIPSTLPKTPKAALATVNPQVPVHPAKPVTKLFVPADFQSDSASYCQKRIGEWTETDVYNLFGDPLRQRSAPGGEKKDNGRILAFADPTGKYREIELDFAPKTGLLRSVFVYPWQMSWQECRRRWDGEVSSTEANKGRIFYSYQNRRLDVLVDSSGKVISLGFY